MSVDNGDEAVLRAGIERRRFMQCLLALGGIAAGCSSSGSQIAASDAGAAGSPGFASWTSCEALRNLVRTSPDHLSARASQIIAKKDFSAAVRFIRDNVAVLPPSDPSDSALLGVRWGPDAALRAGAGTQRERAELLRAMLSAMGASARVVYCNRPTAVDDTTLYATRTPTFSVDYDKLDVSADLRNRIGSSSPKPADPSIDSAVASILALLPAGQAKVDNPIDGIANLVPIVEYTAAGATRWAIALGSLDEVTDPPDGLSSSALEPPTYPNVSVRLLGTLSGVPDVPGTDGLVELVAGSFSVDQLAGSRVFVTTSSSDPQTTANATGDAVGVRTAVLTVQQAAALTSEDPAIWTPKLVAAAPPVGGHPFTLSGARYDVPTNPGDPVAGPYGNVLHLDEAAHAAALASVKSLSATVFGSAFPDIRVNVSALDANGAPVFGLAQSDFTMTDETVQQSPVLLANTAASVKVLLSYDCSGSVTWPTPADKTAFDSALANAMVASATAVPFELGVADVGTNPSLYATPDATAILTAIQACASSSDIWATLGKLAPSAGVSAVVLVSDFQPTDDPTTIPALQQKLAASGLAVALVPVSANVDQNTVNAIVKACGATVLDWTAADFQAKVAAFVTEAAVRATAVGYRSTYHLPDDQLANQGTRSVAVALASNASLSTAAQYQVPAADSRTLSGVAGLYLELRVGTSKKVTRRLSGPVIDSSGETAKATKSDYDATRALLNGLVTIAFEPGSPTTAQSVDELMASALSLQTLADKIGQPVADTMTAGGDIWPRSASLCALFEPLPASTSVTAPQALRVAIMTEALEDHGFMRRFDVVPELNLTVAAQKDAAAAFTATMRATLPLSFREGMVLTRSAATDLAGSTLQYLAPSAGAESLKGFSDVDRADWAAVLQQYDGWHRFVPTTPSTAAMWIVDPATGTAIAVYQSGMGGGCGKAAANAAVQTALFLCGAYASYKSFVCKQESGVSAYQCLGAFVGSIAAGTSGILAAAILDTVSFLDIFIVFLSLIAVPFEGGVGVGVSVAGFEVYGLETAASLYDHC
ncbi:MAG: hypothetical protein HY898_27430 [Deltaproteobacteria bacterium]|nr:hypothetical protein [Deltaproteobacteria bacterium]